MRFDVLALIAAAALALAYIYRRDRQRIDSERKVLFEDLRGLLSGAELSRVALEYPKLRGRYKGHDVVIDAVLDNLAVRKVPSLWLRVTLFANMPFAGSCDILARSHNVEFYSPSNSFDHAVRVPDGWPQHVSIKCDDPATAPDLALLDPHVGLFNDEQAKEMLVTPRGIRLVRQAAQAARAEYLVLRQSHFGAVTVPRETVVHLLDRALAIADDLCAAGCPGSVTDRRE